MRSLNIDRRNTATFAVKMDLISVGDFPTARHFCFFILVMLFISARLGQQLCR
jgi:hypothetical protein